MTQKYTSKLDRNESQLMRPQLCHEREVLAQIKLRFRNTSGQELTATRSLQVTVKKNGALQQKTLEAQLQITKNGERSSRSVRVTELDQLMPNYLGVSKAVLDCVVFCHQDESLWPMSTSTDLKKKFDEIFEALKYTKAVDSLKKLKKTKTEDLKLLKEKENTARYIKDKGDKAEKQSRTLTAEIEDLRAQIAEIEVKASEAWNNWREASNHAARYLSDVESLKFKKKEQGWIQQSIDSIGKNLKKRNESDDWLQSELDNYEERMGGHKEHLAQQTEQYNILMRDIDAARKLIEGKIGEVGKYRQQEIDHQQQLNRRKIMIRDSAHENNIRGYDTDLDDMQIAEFINRLVRVSKDQGATEEKTLRENDRAMQKVRDLLSRFREQRSTLAEARNSAKEHVGSNDRRIAVHQSAYNEIQVDDSEKAILEDNISNIEARRKTTEHESKKASWDSKLNDIDSQLRTVDQKNSSLNEELNGAIEQGKELASLELYETELSERERGLEKTSGVHSHRLQAVVGSGWKSATLEADFKHIVDQISGQVLQAERQRDFATQNLKQIEYELKSTKKDLQKAEKEAAACVTKLKESVDCIPENYHEALVELQDLRDHYKADHDNFINMRAYFTRAVGVAEKRHQCSLCTRSFQGDEEQYFVSRMNKKIEKDISDAERDLNDSEAELRKAKEAGSSHEMWSRLSKTNIPLLQDVVTKKAAEREELLRVLDEHDKKVGDLLESKADVDGLTNVVSKIVKYYQEIMVFSTKIDEHKAKRQEDKISRTIDEIRLEMATLGGKSQALRNNADKLRKDKERAQKQIVALDLDLSNTRSKLFAANHQLDIKANLLNQIEELKILNRELREKIRSSDEQLQELTPQIAEEEAKLKDFEERRLEKTKEFRQEATRLSESLNKLQLVGEAIAVYQNDGIPAKLSKCQRDVDNVQQQIDRIEEEKTQVTRSINKIKEELRDHEEIQASIRNNISYRDRLRELEKVETEIARLSVDNAEADLNRWQKKAGQWERISNDHKSKKMGLIGQATAKDNVLAGLIKEWEIDYQGAANDFKKAHIEVEVSKNRRGSLMVIYSGLLE